MKTNKNLLPSLIIGLSFIIGCFILARGDRYMNAGENESTLFDKRTKTLYITYPLSDFKPWKLGEDAEDK